MREFNYVLTKEVSGRPYWLGKDRWESWCLVGSFEEAWEFVSEERAKSVLSLLDDHELKVTPV